MKIGIIGSGMIGATTARLFAQAGHQVAIANSRGPASLSDLIGAIGSNARAATVDEAAEFGDVVLLAIPPKAYGTLPAARLAGKIVIDAMNYYPARDGQIDLGGPSSQFVARQLPGARVVKAFNTMYFQTLGASGDPAASPDERLAIFLAGDDAEAKATVGRLIEAIGFTPVDTGSLADSARQQPGAAIYNAPMTARDARAAPWGPVAGWAGSPARRRSARPHLRCVAPSLPRILWSDVHVL